MAVGHNDFITIQYGLTVFLLCHDDGRLSPQNIQLSIYVCFTYLLVVILNSIKADFMKCILSSCLCIIVCMHASAQTDSTVIKEAAMTIFLQKTTLKKNSAFSKHLFINSNLPNSYNRFHMFPNYQTMYPHSYRNYKWQTVYEVMGHTLLSIIADKNHYYYNSIPPKMITRQ